MLKRVRFKQTIMKCPLLEDGTVWQPWRSDDPKLHWEVNVGDALVDAEVMMMYDSETDTYSWPPGYDGPPAFDVNGKPIYDMDNLFEYGYGWITEITEV